MDKFKRLLITQNKVKIRNWNLNSILIDLSNLILTYKINKSLGYRKRKLHKNKIQLNF